MLKVMLVDDEPIILKGLKRLIPWSETEFEIVAEAFDGEDALQMFQEKEPDIIITDLLMPGMDGIELIRRLKEINRNIKIIILSGHGEFEYAREALKNGVFEYLLKPVAKQQLTDSLQKVSEVIASDKEFSIKLKKLKEQLRESMPLLKDKFLLDVIQGTVSAGEDIAEKSRLLDIDLEGNGYALLAVQLENVLENRKFEGADSILLQQFAVRNIAEEVLLSRSKGFVVASGDVLFVLIINHQKRITNKDIFDLAVHIKDCLKQYLDVDVTVGAGRLYPEAYQIPKSRSEALTALNNRFFMGRNTIIHINNVLSASGGGMNGYPEEEEQKVLEVIKYYQNEEPEELASRLMKPFIRASSSNIEQIYLFCYEFCVQLRRMLNSLHAEAGSFLSDLAAIHDSIKKCQTVHELESRLKHLISRACENIGNLRKSREYDVIEEAKSFIKSNFAAELSLNAVAGKVFMSPTYFSTLFKNRTGENFFDYLVKIRMEEAARLLKDDVCKVYEIAEKVGYKNARCFSEAFKRFYGVIPTSYKEKLLMNGN